MDWWAGRIFSFFQVHFHTGQYCVIAFKSMAMISYLDEYLQSKIILLHRTFEQTFRKWEILLLIMTPTWPNKPSPTTIQVFHQIFLQLTYHFLACLFLLCRFKFEACVATQSQRLQAKVIPSCMVCLCFFQVALGGKHKLALFT